MSKKDELLAFNKEVYEMYKKMSQDDKSLMFAYISGCLSAHIEEGKKTVDIERLLNSCKSYIDGCNK